MSDRGRKEAFMTCQHSIQRGLEFLAAPHRELLRKIKENYPWSRERPAAEPVAWTIRERFNQLRVVPQSFSQILRALMLWSKGQDSCGTPRHA